MFKILAICIFPLFVAAQSDTEQIRKVIMDQQDTWNRGDIPSFMEGYWHSDKLTFTGKAGVVYGWEATLKRYQTTYNSPEKMGQLTFDLKETKLLGKKHAKVIGSWHLSRPKEGDIGGYFTLVFQKINGKWLIISDHTS